MSEYFPYDCDTLWIIKEVEAYLGFKNREIYIMRYDEVIEYIDKLALILLRNGG